MLLFWLITKVKTLFWHYEVRLRQTKEASQQRQTSASVKVSTVSLTDAVIWSYTKNEVLLNKLTQFGCNIWVTSCSDESM